MNLSFGLTACQMTQRKPVAAQWAAFIQLWRVLVAIGVLACFTPGTHAETLKEKAVSAAIADGATTLGALALGASESNPLGLAAIALKVPVLAYIGTLPEEDRAYGYAMQSSIWGAAAANNVCVIAALATGGAFAPACLIVGVAWGFREWSASAEEREFWEMCAGWRAERPELTCSYTKPEQPTELAKVPAKVIDPVPPTSIAGDSRTLFSSKAGPHLQQQ